MSATTLANDISTRIAKRVEKTVGARKFSMWFDHAAQFDYQDRDRKLHIAVPSRFAADWIGRNFQSDLMHAAELEVGKEVIIDLDVRPEAFGRAETRPEASVAPKPEPATPQAPRPGRSSGQYAAVGSAHVRHRLQDFILGPSNELAYAAATRIADDQDGTAGHPLFLHGGCGLGKTHLLQGICQRVLDHNPAAKVIYTTGEQFTNEYITAIRLNKLDAFRRKIRKLDLLAVDDVHFLADKNKTQQEFLHSFDEMDLGGARLVFASDSHPKLIKKFSEALISRFVRGLVVEVHEPDAGTRQALIQRLSQRRGMVLMPTVAEVLASRCEGSVREIEGTLTKLHALAAITGSSAANTPAPQGGVVAIGHAVVNRLFENEAHNRPLRPVRYADIQATVCERLHVTPAQLAGPGRHKQLVLARSLTIHLARDLTPMSYPEIAAGMGKSNHSTIITAAKRFARQLETNEPLLLTSERSETTPRVLVEELRRQAIRTQG